MENSLITYTQLIYFSGWLYAVCTTIFCSHFLFSTLRGENEVLLDELTAGTSSRSRTLVIYILLNKYIIISTWTIFFLLYCPKIHYYEDISIIFRHSIRFSTWFKPELHLYGRYLDTILFLSFVQAAIFDCSLSEIKGNCRSHRSQTEMNWADVGWQAAPASKWVYVPMYANFTLNPSYLGTDIPNLTKLL